VSSTLHDAFVRPEVGGNLRDDRAARGRQRLREELMSVEPLAFDGEEDRVRLHFARVDDDGRGESTSPPWTTVPPIMSRELGEGQRRHGDLPEDVRIRSDVG
jgi:hypothetical protein